MTLERPDSVFYGKDRELLPKLLDFYVAPDARILDCTANRRRMWEGVVRAPAPIFMDLDPTVGPDVVGDFRALPFPDASFDVLVFDPPHLPQAATSPGSSASPCDTTPRRATSRSVANGRSWKGSRATSSSSGPSRAAL